MVGVGEEAELNRLELQVENGGGDVWEYLSLVKKLKVRRSEKVLQHGMTLLDDPKARSKLRGEVWTLYEQVAIAAMDCQRLDIAKECVQTLMKKFPDSTRVGRLEGMWFEAKGSWAQAEKVYSGLLEEHPLDQVLYSLGGLENLKMARKYYAAAIDLSGGRNTRALYGVCMCGVAINQLTKGRSREEKENSDLQSLAAAALVKDYKQRSPEKAPLVTSVLEQMKAFS